MDKSILFVDDERQILKAINRIFIGSDYTLYFAEGGREALKILEENEIDMVVSDMKMPEMNGYELLKQVKLRYPLTIRIILSGYSDEEVIYKAIQNSTVKLYLFKPWKGEEVKNIIDEIFKTQELLKSKKILDIINSMENLPTLPNVYFKLKEAIENDLDLDSISGIIEADQALSSELLRVVNSSFYGIKTGSVKNAILNLGIFNIKSIILASGLFNKSQLVDENIRVLWKHSNITNKLMVKMYKGLLNKKLSENYSSAGLLHDIGRLVIAECYPKEFKIINALISSSFDKTDYEIEKEIIDISHNELGAYLLNWWEIPIAIVEVALYHDTPALCTEINRELVSMVHIANYYSWKIIDEKRFIQLDEQVFTYLGISKEQCDEFVKSIINEVEEYEKK